MLSLDSDSIVQEIQARNPGQQWDIDQRKAEAHEQALKRQAKKAVTQQKFKASRLTNEQYNFKLTSQQTEVRVHYINSVINENGEWSQSTRQHCRFDGQPFQGPPCTVPVRCTKGNWQTQGCFCSWSCARSWLETQPIRPAEQDRRLQWMREMASRYFGLTAIHCALPLEALEIYGGFMAVEEWREAAKSRTSTILFQAPLEPLDEIVIERIQDWQVRKQHHEFYNGRTLEEKKQKELERQQKLEHDTKLAADREIARQRKQAARKNTLFQTMNITLVDSAE